MYYSTNRKIFYTLLVTWWFLVFGNLIFDILKNGDTMFHGDTMNVHISISAIVIPLAVLAVALVIKVIMEDMKQTDVNVEWNSRNRLMLYLILGPLPIQGMLLASGDPHGITDQIGVISCIAQCFLIPFIMRPYKPKARVALS